RRAPARRSCLLTLLASGACASRHKGGSHGRSTRSLWRPRLYALPNNLRRRILDQVSHPRGGYLVRGCAGGRAPLHPRHRSRRAQRRLAGAVMGRAVEHRKPTKAQIDTYLEKLRRTDPRLWANIVADPQRYGLALACAVYSRLRRAKEYPRRNA